MKQKEKSNTLTKVVIAILIALLLGLLGYLYTSNTELEKSNSFLEDEKVKIEQNLDEMIAKYDQAIEENSSISDELRKERENIVLFRDSVKNLKQTNYSIISRYRKKIKSLELANQELFRTNDSLRVSNQFLANKIDSANVRINSQKAALDTLNSKNIELIEKVQNGAKLQINSIKINPMKQRSSGKLSTTERARRTDALRISFRIAKNSLAKKGDQIATIQVLNPQEEVVHKIGIGTLKNGEEIGFSDKTTVAYTQENIDVISLIEVDRKKMVKGTHTVKVYLQGRFVGSTNFVLK